MDMFVDVAIVGGGFSGTMTAAHLLRQTARPLAIALIERRPPVGRGVAYGTTHPSHLLNIPAAEMSAWPEVMDDFISWVQSHGEYNLDNTYISRMVFGRYVAEQLATRSPMHRFETVADEAIGCLPAQGRYRLRLASGAIVTASQVVFALGQFPPAPLRVAAPFAGGPWYVEDAWRPEAQAALPPGARALLVGTGLTAVDVAVSLLEASPDAVVHLVSRRAQLPAPQREAPAYRDWFDPASAPTRVSHLAAMVRREIAHARTEGVEWRAVLDAMKPHLGTLWTRLPLVERRRFLRHARSYWEAHRNRLPPPTAARVAQYREAGRLVVHAGRLTALEEGEAGAIATLALRSGGTVVLAIARLVNCTGPDTQYRQINHPLVLDLIGTGLARPDPLGLGLDAAADGRLKDEDGLAGRPLYTLGWPRQGQLWEATTVPSLREQARDVASRVLNG